MGVCVKNKLLWVGVLSFFVADLITTYIGLSVGAIEMNPFIKTFPFMFMAKVGALIFMFGVFKYFDYLSIKSSNRTFMTATEILKKFIVIELVVLGVGIGVINNIIVIRGYL